ncbi:MAG: hypothetical protein ABL995_05495 [Bryobacteraceae bacterium]
MKPRTRFTLLGLLGLASLLQAPLVFAQNPNGAPAEDSGGWRRLGEAAPQGGVRDDAADLAQNEADQSDADQNDIAQNTFPPPPDSADGGWRRMGQPGPQGEPGDFAQNGAPPPPDYAQRRGPMGPAGPPPANPRGRMPQMNQPMGPPPAPAPAQLNIAAGTFFTIRVNQPLSSDRNQVGDAFTAQLVKPIVVDGIVVADRGQTIAGRVAEVAKGGRIKGTSRLGIELTELTLVDGQQIPLRSQLIGHEGPGSVGRDATAIGATTGLGALVGAAAAGGEGAAIGAGAGAAASVIGVLLTRGNPTIIYPESVLTFRMEQPIAINTTRAPQAFRPVGPGDYNQPSDQPRLQTRVQGNGPNPWFGPYYGGGLYGSRWGGWGYPGYFGPSVGFVYRGYYGGGRGFGGPRGGFRGRR